VNLIFLSLLFSLTHTYIQYKMGTESKTASKGQPLLKGVGNGTKVGFNKGFIVTRRQPRFKTSRTKGVTGRRTRVVRNVIREVCGWAPYERRIQELLKGGGNNPVKRAVRFARNRLGSHQRAKRKIAEMQDFISTQQS
jgi:large subunit ribosomal protein L36e